MATISEKKTAMVANVIHIPENARRIAKQNGCKIRFPHQFYDLVEYCHMHANHAMCWYQDGDQFDGVIVKDDDAIVTIIRQSKIFKLKTFASFQHQLNDHSFNIDKGLTATCYSDGERVFRRPEGAASFVRGEYDALEKIRSTSVAKKRKRVEEGSAGTTAEKAAVSSSGWMGQLPRLGPPPSDPSPLSQALYEIAHDGKFIATVVDELRRTMVISDTIVSVLPDSARSSVMSPSDNVVVDDGEPFGMSDHAGKERKRSKSSAPCADDIKTRIEAGLKQSLQRSVLNVVCSEARSSKRRCTAELVPSTNEEEEEEEVGDHLSLFRDDETEAADVVDANDDDDEMVALSQESDSAMFKELLKQNKQFMTERKERLLSKT